LKAYPRIFALIAALIILGNNDSVAQSNEPYIYAELGGGNGNYTIVKTAVNTICYNNNIISLSYYFSERQSPNAPADFRWGDFVDGYSAPQSLTMYGISYGKVFFLKHRYLRFTAKGGLTEGTVSTPTDYIFRPTVFGPYYLFSYHKSNVTGIVLDPTLEWDFARGFGLSMGLYTNINAISSVIGIDVRMIFGRLTGKRVYKKH
jgi:hypothetical protein